MFLFLNSLGTWEVIFIFVVVLLLFGSESIPGIAKTLGRGMREIQNASNEIKRDIQNSVTEIKKEVNLPQNFLEEEKKENIGNPKKPTISEKKESQPEKPAEP